MGLSSFSFQSLTPDVILDALDSIGVRAGSGLTALNSYENRVYQFLDEQNKRYVVKFYRPQRWSYQQLIEEHQFIDDLVKAEIPVVPPININGQTLHEYHDYLFCLYHSIGGRPYEVDNEHQLEWVGRTLGRLHRIAGEKQFTYRPTIGLDEYIYQPRQILADSVLLPKIVRQPFLSTLDNLIDTIQQYWQNNWHCIRLHGDCHPGNILWRDGPLLVDFDDARNGPAIQDLWMLLHGDRREQTIQLDILLEAYAEFAEFNYNELRLLEPLRAMRMIHYLAWVVNRWDDPAFPANFVWMRDETFWRDQLSQFAEQIHLMEKPSLQLLYEY